MFEFDDIGIHLSGSVYNSKTQWAMFSKFAENKKVFIVYQQGDQIFLTLPKRTLPPKTVDSIRGMLEKHLKSS